MTHPEPLTMATYRAQRVAAADAAGRPQRRMACALFASEAPPSSPGTRRAGGRSAERRKRHGNGVIWTDPKGVLQWTGAATHADLCPAGRVDVTGETATVAITDAEVLATLLSATINDDMNVRLPVHAAALTDGTLATAIQDAQEAQERGVGEGATLFVADDQTSRNITGMLRAAGRGGSMSLRQVGRAWSVARGLSMDFVFPVLTRVLSEQWWMPSEASPRARIACYQQAFRPLLDDLGWNSGELAPGAGFDAAMVMLTASNGGNMADGAAAALRGVIIASQVAVGSGRYSSTRAMHRAQASAEANATHFGHLQVLDPLMVEMNVMTGSLVPFKPILSGGSASKVRGLVPSSCSIQEGRRVRMLSRASADGELVACTGAQQVHSVTLSGGSDSLRMDIKCDSARSRMPRFVQTQSGVGDLYVYQAPYVAPSSRPSAKWAPGQGVEVQKPGTQRDVPLDISLAHGPR